MDFTPLSSILDFGGKLIDRLIPDPAQKLAAQKELAQMAINKELADMANDAALMKMQTDINAIEAASPNLFVSGARPALVWVGVAGVAYQWVFAPLFTFGHILVTGKPLSAPLPQMDPNLILMLGGLMGLHTMARSYEKVKGAA